MANDLLKELSAEEAEEFKQRKALRAKELDELIEAMSDQAWKAAYLAEHGEKTVTVDFLSEALARLRKRLTRQFMEDLTDRWDEIDMVWILQRNRFRTLEADVAALKAQIRDQDRHHSARRSGRRGASNAAGTLGVTVSTGADDAS